MYREAQTQSSSFSVIQDLVFTLQIHPRQAKPLSQAFHDITNNTSLEDAHQVQYPAHNSCCISCSALLLHKCLLFLSHTLSLLQASNSCFITVLKSSPGLLIIPHSLPALKPAFVTSKPVCLVKSTSTIDVTLKNKHTDQTLKGSIGVLLVSPGELQTPQPNPFQSTLLSNLQGPSLLVSTCP